MNKQTLEERIYNLEKQIKIQQNEIEKLKKYIQNMNKNTVCTEPNEVLQNSKDIINARDYYSDAGTMLL